jgi:hypothetical protein
VHLRLQVQLQMNNRGPVYQDRKKLSAEEPETAANFVLADDGYRVAIADTVLVGEPVSTLVAAEEGGTALQVAEPL